ncbi:hypothetical protein DUK53_14950 [Listeria sp. SHR_NRA_18]|uniref:hypothetical protein n=1 Tax=Listeria sp. SHR_NRA_18 TaxID=2269046 RepID=UPI000F5DAD4E|nr:hypothetical protein [Listeria sp. SHR_NRA_18]RQW65687.1 hypothetical protein DUK53_14950 [Listeria sp. SHR_NRA_18]
MKKMAMTYFYDIMRPPQMFDINIHESGTKAIAFFKENCQKYFHQPVQLRANLSIPTVGQVTIGVGLRQMVARFLTEEEAEIYKVYGEKSLINFKTMELEAPEEGKQ